VPGEYKVVYDWSGTSASFRVSPGIPMLLSAARAGMRASADNLTGTGERIELYGLDLEYGCPAPRQVVVGGQPAKTIYSGKHSVTRGAYQINIEVPAGIDPGPGVPVVIKCQNGQTTNAIVIGVR